MAGGSTGLYDLARVQAIEYKSSESTLTVSNIEALSTGIVAYDSGPLGFPGP